MASAPLVRVRVPVGVRGGDQVCLDTELLGWRPAWLEPASQTLTISVPEGMVAGDDFLTRPMPSVRQCPPLLPIALSTLTVPCDHCFRTHLASILWKVMTFDAVELSEEDAAGLAEPLPSTLPLRQLEIGALGLFEIHQRSSCFLWDAELFLAHTVVLSGLVSPGSTVLELGAGTGLAGIVAGRLGAQVVLSDIVEDALELCERNILANQLDPEQKNVATLRLEWGCAESSIAGWLGAGTARLVLACEVLHREDYFLPLLVELQHRCGPCSVVLLAFDVRNIYREARFFELAARGFDVEPIPAAWVHEQYACRNGKSKIVVMRPKADVSVLYETRSGRQGQGPCGALGPDATTSKGCR